MVNNDENLVAYCIRQEIKLQQQFLHECYRAIFMNTRSGYVAGVGDWQIKKKKIQRNIKRLSVVLKRELMK